MIEQKKKGRGNLLALVNMSDDNSKEDRKKFMAYAKADADAWDRKIIFCPDMKGTKMSFKTACDKISRLAGELKINNFSVVEAPLTGSLGAYTKSVEAAHILIEIPPRDKKFLGVFDLDIIWETYIWKMVKSSHIDVTIICKGSIFTGYQELVVPIDRWNNVYKFNGVITIAKKFSSNVVLFVENPLLDEDRTTTIAALNNALIKLDADKISRSIERAVNKTHFPLQLLRYTISAQKKHMIVEVPPKILPMEFLSVMKDFFNEKNPNLTITLVKYQRKETYRY
jgi:hypothetical protein